MATFYLQAALFTRVVEIGEKNPEGEVTYRGYKRVRFAASVTKNLEPIEFPEAEIDYKDADGNFIRCLCVAALTEDGTVVGIELLNSENIL